MSASHFPQGPDVGSVINIAWTDGMLASMPGKHERYLINSIQYQELGPGLTGT